MGSILTHPVPGCLALPHAEQHQPGALAHCPHALSAPRPQLHQQPNTCLWFLFPLYLCLQPRKELAWLTWAHPFNQTQTAFSEIKGVCLGSFHVAVGYPSTTLLPLGNSPLTFSWV